MNDTKIQIADESRPESAVTSRPYGNLWVPLIVVPAGIVIAVVVVVALFGSLTGEEASLDENLDKIVHGGRNERDQALMSLSIQAAANHAAAAEGRELPWAMEDGFPDRVRAALDELDPDEYRQRLVLGMLMASIDEPAGVTTLLGLLELDDGADPGGEVRFQAMRNLGLIGDSRATPAVRRFLTDPDAGLRAMAATCLANLQGPDVREALAGALGDSSLEVRANAAIALSKLEPPDPRAGPVLRELLDPAVYEAENERDDHRYRLGRLVSAIRVRALQALSELALEEDLRVFERLRDDPDVAVAEAALAALASRKSQ